MVFKLLAGNTSYGFILAILTFNHFYIFYLSWYSNCWLETLPVGLFGPKMLIYDQNERNKQGTGGLGETTVHFLRASVHVASM